LEEVPAKGCYINLEGYNADELALIILQAGIGTCVEGMSPEGESSRIYALLEDV